MRTELLEYFIRAVDEGSFNKAAQSLFMAQSSLSEAIQTLEKEIGGALLIRSQKGVTLTRLGQRVYCDSKRIMEMVREWEGGAQVNGGLGHRIRLLGTPAICSMLLCHLATQLLERYSDLQIELREGRGQEILSLYQENEYQMVFSFAQRKSEDRLREWAKDSHLRMEELFTDEYCAVVGSGSPLASRESVGREELKECKVAVYRGEDENMPQLVREIFPEKNILYIDGRASVLHMIAHQQAVGILPCKLTSHELLCHMGAICTVPLRASDKDIFYFAAYDSVRISSASARILMEKVRGIWDKMN